jgi:hypothetical protein
MMPNGHTRNMKKHGKQPREEPHVTLQDPEAVGAQAAAAAEVAGGPSKFTCQGFTHLDDQRREYLAVERSMYPEENARAIKLCDELIRLAQSEMLHQTNIMLHSAMYRPEAMAKKVWWQWILGSCSEEVIIRRGCRYDM